MTKDIIHKLQHELSAGITSEGQVVYLLAGVRRIIERDRIASRYATLKFHCDWALQASIDGVPAEALLKQFAAAHGLLAGDIERSALPSDLRDEIERISQMMSFKNELGQLLASYGLPALTQHRRAGRSEFHHLFTKVVEDMPLVVNGSGAQAIVRVTVACELARETHRDVYGNDDMFYTMTWNILDVNGQRGEIAVINSYAEPGWTHLTPSLRDQRPSGS